MHRFMASSGKCIRALILMILIGLRLVNIHIHTLNNHTEFTLYFRKAGSVVHYTDLCGLDHLDKVGEKCTRRKRNYIQAWDPEVGLWKKQRSYSTSGSGSPQLKPWAQNTTVRFWTNGYLGIGPHFHPGSWNKAISFDASI